MSENEKKGMLIAIEGTDGSGKHTQTSLLARTLKKQEIPYRQVSFPSYGKPQAALVEQYLNGAFGEDPKKVNAYAASSFYAADRYVSYQMDWGAFYREGGLVIADRYTTSNAIHQGCKLVGADRTRFLRWLFDYEYHRLGIPEPDLVLYLDVPAKIASANYTRRAQLAGMPMDIHERDAFYLRHCRRVAVDIAKRYHWCVIPCTEEGEMLSPEAIHQVIWKIVQPLLNL